MPRDGKLSPGERLYDPTAPRGYVVEIVAITSGRMPTPIDPRGAMRGSAAEMCALYGGAKQTRLKKDTNT